MEKRELVALLSLSSWCLVIVVWLFLAVPWVCLQFVIVVFPDHTHLLFYIYCLMYFPWFVGNLCLSWFCYALLCVDSSFTIILKRKRKLVASLLLT